jgi:hypothetical protein
VAINSRLAARNLFIRLEFNVSLPTAKIGIKLEVRMKRFEFRVPNAEVQDSGHYEVEGYYLINT